MQSTRNARPSRARTPRILETVPGVSALGRIAIAALLVCSLSDATAQVAWTANPAGPSPSARTAHGLAFDKQAGVAVLFGGCGGTTCFSDTWLYDPTTQQWSLQSPQNSPPARYGHAMAYDESRNVVVLFGGGDLNQNLFDDTWEWDGNDWTHVNITTPVARWNHAMAWDPVRQNIVMVGGSDRLGSFPDTWIYIGTRWIQIFQPGNHSQISPGLAYDPVGGTLLLFGGIDFRLPPASSLTNTVFRWTGFNWQQVFVGTAPPPRFAHSMVLDEVRERIVLFGGSQDVNPIGGPYLADAWEWTGTAWVERDPGAGPTSRAWTPTVYDPGTRRVLLFGGSSNTTTFGDGWSYGAVNDAVYDAYGAGCAGTSGMPTLSVSSSNLPWIGETFRIDLANLTPGNPTWISLSASRTQFRGILLPFDLTVLQMPGCSLLAGLERIIPVANASGQASYSAVVPADPSLIGGKFFNQGITTDVVNPGGLIVSNGGEGTVGAK